MLAPSGSWESRSRDLPLEILDSGPPRPIMDHIPTSQLLHMAMRAYNNHLRLKVSLQAQ